MLVASALLAGCADGAAPAPSGGEGNGELFPITVLGTQTAIDTAVYAAIDSGAFEEAGLDVTVNNAAQSPSEAMPMLLNGELSLIIAEIHSAILARTEGIELEMVVPVFSGYEPEDGYGFANIFVRDDGSITSPKDLEGKNVAVNGVGEQPWMEASAVLEREGVDVSTVNWVAVLVPQQVAALQQGQVDAIVIPEPLGTFATLEGGVEQLINIDDAFVGAPRFAYAGLSEALAANPDKFATFAEVLLAEAAKVNDDPELRVSTTLGFMDVPAEVLEVAAFPKYSTRSISQADYDLWVEQIGRAGLAADIGVLAGFEEVTFSG